MRKKRNNKGNLSNLEKKICLIIVNNDFLFFYRKDIEEKEECVGWGCQSDQSVQTDLTKSSDANETNISLSKVEIGLIISTAILSSGIIFLCCLQIYLKSRVIRY